MADSSPERPQADKDDVELNNDLEKMTECVENMSGECQVSVSLRVVSQGFCVFDVCSHWSRPPAVQLTWMAYDLVALRTSPELGALLRGLEEPYHRCRAAVCGARSQEPELEDRADHSQIWARSPAHCWAETKGVKQSEQDGIQQLLCFVLVNIVIAVVILLLRGKQEVRCNCFWPHSNKCIL